jgi:hypothetical protein
VYSNLVSFIDDLTGKLNEGATKRGKSGEVNIVREIMNAIQN